MMVGAAPGWPSLRRSAPFDTYEPNLSPQTTHAHAQNVYRQKWVEELEALMQAWIATRIDLYTTEQISSRTDGVQNIRGLA